MITLPGGRNDLAAQSAPSTTAGPAPHTEDTVPISVQRCLPVTAAHGSLASDRRSGARTQLGMPALTPAPPKAPSAADTSRTALPSLVPPPTARPRRGPPPLPACFAAPKVIVAATPLLSDTVPARRLQLADATCELDAADLLPIPTRRAAARSPAELPRATPHAAPAQRGVRGLVANLLVRLLSLLEPSVQMQKLPRDKGNRSTLRRS